MPVEHIPLGALLTSKRNVRRTDRKADLDALAASIAAHGLLQNLTVVRAPEERFEVVAGARRHAALKLLAKAGTIARDFAVPCFIIDEGDAAEASLAENVQRVAMDVMDEVDAFAALAAGGMPVDDIARRFGAGVRHVEQRLALARLSPKIKAAYRKGDVSLDAARAFCISDDTVQQETVFRQMAKPIVHAAGVRAHLTRGRVPASDRLATLVGIDAYEAAGGRIVRDLFEPDLAYFDDGELLRRLAFEMADVWRGACLAEGWGWVEINLGHARFEGMAGERLEPTRRPLDPDERDRLGRLDDEIAVLEDALADAEDEDERFAELDRLVTARDEIADGSLSWDRERMAHAGVVISVDHGGRPSFVRGVIKRTDLKAIAKLGARRDTDGGDVSGEVATTAAATPDSEYGPRPGRGLTEALTRARTVALRAALVAHPQAALALLVHVLASRSIGAGVTLGVDIVARTHLHDDAAAFVAAREDMQRGWRDDGPRLDALFASTSEDLLKALAVLTAETIDLSHAGVDAGGGDRQALADALASALDLDMAAYWTPQLEFWMQCPKAYILKALADAPSMAALAARRRGVADARRWRLASRTACDARAERCARAHRCRRRHR
ncbi:MAG: chromosome partitioning protein, ParB family [Alphaproteobacteria bacterium]|nr:MAG: chromosome partitioning protein, ParB family [Alphaproteobacteria bacterium]